MDQIKTNHAENVVSGIEPAKAGAKEWLGLAVLILPTLLLALDITVLHLALPHFAVDLQANSTQQLWILDIYGFMIAGFLVTMGTLGDRIGRKRLLLIGASAFGLASIAAAYSTSAEMLLFTRALLGISGATLMPSTLSLIHNMFHDPKQRMFAISIWMMSFSGGAVLGPAIGGILLEFFWWGSVFLLGVPVMLLLLIAGPFLLPEYRDPQAGKLDFVSVVLSLAAILPIIYGIKEIAHAGLGLTPLLIITLGIGVGWIFIKRQHKLQDPLLELTLFQNRAFSGSLGMMLLGTATQGGFVLLFAQYLQMVAGMPPLEAGLLMIPLSVGSMIGSLTAPIFTRWVSRAIIIGIGLGVSAGAYAMLIFVSYESSILIPIVSSVLLTVGFGPLFVLSTDLIINSAPPEKSGSAASLSETSGELGMALGIAVFGSIATGIYRLHMKIPDHIPAEFAEPVQDSIAGAVGSVEHLPKEIAVDVLIQAHESFMQTLNMIGGISTAVLLGLVLMSFLLLRQTEEQ